MNIIETNLNFNGLTRRNSTNRLILHNSGVTVLQSIETIHNYHQRSLGWAGIGYHFYIRKDGSTYRGRPEDTIGAHAYGNNGDSIGICFEGNFNEETMGEAQKQAGKELVAYLKQKYGITKVQGHRDVNATSCPGNNFPFDEIANAEGETTGEEPTDKAEGVIADIQAELNARYGFNIAVDNVAGNQTKSALVRGLQIELVNDYNKNIVIDGIFGNQTKNACITIRKGDYGNVVWLMQARLACLGYDIAVDGDFGSQTEGIVKQFQKAKGTLQDAVVGKVTWGLLFK